MELEKIKDFFYKPRVDLSTAIVYTILTVGAGVVIGYNLPQSRSEQNSPQIEQQTPGEYLEQLDKRDLTGRAVC